MLEVSDMSRGYCNSVHRVEVAGEGEGQPRETVRVAFARWAALFAAGRVYGRPARRWRVGALVGPLELHYRCSALPLAMPCACRAGWWPSHCARAPAPHPHPMPRPQSMKRLLDVLEAYQRHLPEALGGRGFLAGQVHLGGPARRLAAAAAAPPESESAARGGSPPSPACVGGTGSITEAPAHVHTPGSCPAPPLLPSGGGEALQRAVQAARA